MTSNNNYNYNFEAQKALIYDEGNVTETNPLKDLFQIGVKIVLILVSLYLFIFVTSGIIIQSLSPKDQAALENVLSQGAISKIDYNVRDVKLKNAEKVRDRILKVDSDFPQTSKLNIKVIGDGALNALCLPNGDIYITEPLYKKIQDEEMMTFVLAHEMAHYRHRDHLMNLRKGIAGGAVVILTSAVSSQSAKDMSTIIGETISISDLKYSRGVEAKADKYAAEILMKLYGRVDGGIKVLRVLDEGRSNNNPLEIVSTHPDIKKRINNLQKYSMTLK